MSTTQSKILSPPQKHVITEKIPINGTTKRRQRGECIRQEYQSNSNQYAQPAWGAWKKIGSDGKTNGR